MPDLTTGLLALIALQAIFLLYLARHLSQLSMERGGKIMLFLGLMIFPIILIGSGVGLGMERSKSTEFCLSCHEMGVYGKSLYIDDNEFTPAVHFQNGMIPRDSACYTCHTDYTLYGGLSAKLTGLSHVYVHYFGDVPAEGKFELYQPYPNANCLKCHEHSRRFLKSKHHRTEDAPLDQLLSGKASCMTEGCHDLVHNIDEHGDLDFWDPKGGAK